MGRPIGCRLSGVLLLLAVASGVKHVIFMHGILSNEEEFDYLKSVIAKVYPGTNTTSISLYSDAKSLAPMWDQINHIQKEVSQIMLENPGGINMICYSQGGLICRGLVSVLHHNVDTFIALSSPLAGQYGDTKYLKFLFPNFLKANIYKYFYTIGGQIWSIANYWNDPHHQELYQNYASLLPVLNNETTNPFSEEYKENFLRLKRLVLIGGPDDGVITPWQSSQFGFYNASEIVEPMEKQKWFIDDSFGLRTLATTGRVFRHVVPNVQHIHWYDNPTVVEKYVLPYLA